MPSNKSQVINEKEWNEGNIIASFVGFSVRLFLLLCASAHQQTTACFALFKIFCLYFSLYTTFHYFCFFWAPHFNWINFFLFNFFRNKAKSKIMKKKFLFSCKQEVSERVNEQLNKWVSCYCSPFVEPHQLLATVFNKILFHSPLLHHLCVDIYLSFKHIICSLNVLSKRLLLPSYCAVRLVNVVVTSKSDTAAWKPLSLDVKTRNALKHITKVCKVKLFKRSLEMTESPKNSKKKKKKYCCIQHKLNI